MYIIIWDQILYSSCSRRANWINVTNKQKVMRKKILDMLFDVSCRACFFSHFIFLQQDIDHELCQPKNFFVNKIFTSVCHCKVLFASLDAEYFTNWVRKTRRNKKLIVSLKEEKFMRAHNFAVLNGEDGRNFCRLSNKKIITFICSSLSPYLF